MQYGDLRKDIHTDVCYTSLGEGVKVMFYWKNQSCATRRRSIGKTEGDLGNANHINECHSSLVQGVKVMLCWKKRDDDQLENLKVKLTNHLLNLVQVITKLH